MKSTVAIAAAGILLAQSLVAPKPAHALASAGMGFFAMSSASLVALSGSGALVGGSALAWTALLGAWTDVDGHDLSTPVTSIAGWLTVIGVVALDSPNGGSPSFGAITPQQSTTLGVTNPEALVTYNQELPEINAIQETVTAELGARQTRGETISVQDSAALWSRYGSNLSPQSFEVMRAILTQTPATAK